MSTAPSPLTGIFGDGSNLHPTTEQPKPPVPFKPGFVKNLPIITMGGQPAGFLNWTQAADDRTAQYIAALLADLKPILFQASALDGTQYMEPLVWWMAFPNGFNCLVGPEAVYFISYPTNAEKMIRADLAWNLDPPKK